MLKRKSIQLCACYCFCQQLRTRPAQPTSVATLPCSSRTCSGRSRSRESSAHTATPSAAVNSPTSPWEGTSRPSSSPSRDIEESFAATRASVAESFAKAQMEPLKAPRLNWKLPASAAGPLPPAEGGPALASPRHRTGPGRPADGSNGSSGVAGVAGVAGELISAEAPASLRASARARSDRLPQAVSIVFPQPMLSHLSQGPPQHAPLWHPPMPSTTFAQPSQINPSYGSPCAPARLLNGESQAGACQCSHLLGMIQAGQAVDALNQGVGSLGNVGPRGSSKAQVQISYHTVSPSFHQMFARVAGPRNLVGEAECGELAILGSMIQADDEFWFSTRQHVLFTGIHGLAGFAMGRCVELHLWGLGRL